MPFSEPAYIRADAEPESHNGLWSMFTWIVTFSCGVIVPFCEPVYIRADAELESHNGLRPMCTWVRRCGQSFFSDVRNL